MDSENQNKSHQTLSIQYLPFFFSHFFMFIIIFVFTLIGILCSNFQTVGPFYSSNEEINFTSTDYPYYFSQLSDIHLTHGLPKRTEHIKYLFKQLGDKIKPKLVVITGDIADATDSPTFIQQRKQNKQNWDEYNKTLHESGILKVSQIIEIPGNHDIYNVEAEISSKNFFPKYSQHQVKSMNVESFIIDGKYNFISINPVKFPYLSAPLGMIPYTSTSILEEFEKHFIVGNPQISNIIISHYPHYSTWTAHPGKMRRIYSKGRIFLSGHLHPSESRIAHYDKLLAVVSPPASYTDLTALITVESKAAIVYHQIDVVNDDPIIVVTYPVPIEQLSDDQVFNLNDFDVRVLGFSKNELNLRLLIDDKPVGNFEAVNEMNEGVFLYTCSVNNLNDGKHSLKIDGDSKYEMKFYVGNKSPKISEYIMRFATPQFFFGAVAAVSFLILIRFIPFWLLCNETLDRYENYMYYGQALTNEEMEAIIRKTAELKDLSDEDSSNFEDSENPPKDNEPNLKNSEKEEKENSSVEKIERKTIKWYHQMYLGPLYMICRLRKVPLSIYIVLIVLFIWYIPLPFYFTKIESKLAILWCWGYISDSKLFQFNTPLWFLLLYDLMVLFPLIDISGIMFENGKILLVHKIEFVLFCVVMIIAIIAWIVVTYVAGGVFTIFTSFMLYFALFGIIFIFCKIFTNRRKKVEMFFESSY